MTKANGKLKPHRGPKAKPADSPFALETVDCTMGKLSNNLEKHGDEDVTVFTLTIQGISLSKEQVDAHFGPSTYDSWFEVEASTRLPKPMPWWERLKAGKLQLDDKFDVDTAEVTCDDQVLKFESEQHKSDDEKTPGGKVSDIAVEAKHGGVVLMSYHLQVRPGLGTKNTTLQRKQNGHIKVSLGERVGPAAKSRQNELALGAPGEDTADDDAGQEKRDAALAAAATGNPGAKPIDGTTPASRARTKSTKQGAAKH